MKEIIAVFGFMLYVLFGFWLAEVLSKNFAVPLTALFFGALFFFMIRSIYRDRRK